MMAPKKRAEESRFWEKVAKTPSCWLWLGGKTDQGYGVFFLDSPRTRRIFQGAHRWAWENVHGRVPEGLHLDHLCRTPSCVNPTHLEPVTPTENSRRHTSLSVECSKGHYYTEENTRMQLRKSTGNFFRVCRQCARESSRSYEARKRGHVSND